MYIGKIKSDEIYIGDICYMLDEENYKQWGRMNYHDGEIKLDNGFSFIVNSTYYGDGYFTGVSEHKEYKFPVDAGNIGIVPKELFREDRFPFEVGAMFTNTQEAEMYYDDGMFTINILFKDSQTIKIKIKTK